MSFSDTESDISDAVREGLNTNLMLKENYMGHKCKECNCIKSVLKQGFADGVSDHVCQYITCDIFQTL